jgi:hypothetical protein
MQAYWVLWLSCLVCRRFRKTAKSDFVMCVRLSVRMEKTRLPQDGFSWNLIFEYFSEICRKYSSFLKIWQEQHEDLCKCFMSRWIILRMRNVSDGSCREKQNAHFLSNQFSSENSAVYEIMWKNMVEPDRPQTTLRRMRFACWMAEAKHTHTEARARTYAHKIQYVILTAFPQQKVVTRTRLNVTLCVYCLSFLLSDLF